VEIGEFWGKARSRWPGALRGREFGITREPDGTGSSISHNRTLGLSALHRWRGGNDSHGPAVGQSGWQTRHELLRTGRSPKSVARAMHYRSRGSTLLPISVVHTEEQLTAWLRLPGAGSADSAN